MTLNHDPDSDQVASDAEGYLVALFKADLDALGAKLLTETEALTLLAQMRAGDLAARERLIVSLLPMGLRMVRKSRHLEPSDVISACNLAAIKAVDQLVKTFDPDKGQYSTFAHRLMQMELQLEYERQRSVLSIPTDTFHKRRRIKRATERLAQLGQEATLSAISKETGLPSRTIEGVQTIQLPDRSLSEEITDKSEPDPLLLLETVANPNSPTPEELFGSKEGREVIIEILKANLTPRQFEVLTLLYGFNSENESLTQVEIAARLGIPVGRLKGICQQALRVLRRVPAIKPLLQVLATPYRAYGRKHLTTVPLCGEEFHKAYKRSTAHVRKLTDEQVTEVRKLFAAGVRNKDLAAMFKVSPATISYTTRKKFKGPTTSQSVQGTMVAS